MGVPPDEPFRCCCWLGKSGKALLARCARARLAGAFDARGDSPCPFSMTLPASMFIDDDPDTPARRSSRLPRLAQCVPPSIPHATGAFSACEAAGIEVWGEVEPAWRLVKRPCGSPSWFNRHDLKDDDGRYAREILRCAGIKAQSVGNIMPRQRAIDSMPRCLRWSRPASPAAHGSDGLTRRRSSE